MTLGESGRKFLARTNDGWTLPGEELLSPADEPSLTYFTR